ncbi:Origin recognition complex subunit 3 [Penicillium alfredii]|uniref:Origin recognition complex subunit 3 n=1 Tax=Penicillium alfredii TaxID=1506179 RepID=A0A9W9F282_9EURO|nr:Origin recognition complex subunit 3 [Penicillium alfredii]KAJ5092196.1 Origin recognition complex subunit 3 [Penicillium alfredii]
MEIDGFDAEVLESSRDKSQSQGVYIYQPTQQGKGAGERPSKRRKVASTDASEEPKNHQSFAPLLNGDENAECVQLRYDIYKQLWSVQKQKIKGILEDVDAGVLMDVLSFVRNTSPQTYDPILAKEPETSALVTVGSNVSSLSRLLSRLNDQLAATGDGGVVVLESGDAPNLKTTLKNIIRAAVTNTEGNDGYQKFLTDRAGPRLLGYDLDLLHDYVQRKGTKKLVLALRDSEAFDPGLLTDLLSLLRSWLDRIPFTVLLGISTSVELFEGRLPRSCASLLQGRHFEVQEAGNCVDRIYEALQADLTGRLWLGRNITSTLFERSSDFFQSPEAFSRMVKYAYMSHFFANPLAVLLANPASTMLPQLRICEAIRNLPSFRMFCEDLVQAGFSKEVRGLLEDDQYLLQQTSKHLDTNQQKMRRLFQVVLVIHACLQHTQSSKKTSVSDLSIRALSGELGESPIVEEMLATMKTLDSEKLMCLLNSLPRALFNDAHFSAIQHDIQTLLQTYPDSGPLRSEYNTNSSVVKTTVVQQRVRLSKGKAKLPEQDLEYTKIIDRLVAILQEYFAEILVNPQDLFLHELFLFDLRNPLKETFAPRPRFAIERALASPFDYLFSSFDVTEGKISAKQPATAILYQLYLESGALVNVHDLWQAFYAVFESDQGDSCDERVVMTLFYGALSELKAFGVVKNSRKKTDHLAKSAWMGL